MEHQGIRNDSDIAASSVVSRIVLAIVIAGAAFLMMNDGEDGSIVDNNLCKYDSRADVNLSQGNSFTYVGLY